MIDSWKQNEEKNEDDELAVTDHRDQEGLTVTADDDQTLPASAAEQDSREVLEALGEDVASSPARRAHDDIERDRNGAGRA